MVDEDKDLNFSDLLKQAIELELNVSELYNFYYSTFPEDGDFWWELSIEEKNHAALLRSGEKFLEKEIFPKDLLYPHLEKLVSANTYIKGLLKSYKEKSPTKNDAFQTAMKLENSAAELHFQKAMEKEVAEKDALSKVLVIFQELNAADKDHAKRIREYMES